MKTVRNSIIMAIVLVISLCSQCYAVNDTTINSYTMGSKSDVWYGYPIYSGVVIITQDDVDKYATEIDFMFGGRDQYETYPTRIIHTAEYGLASSENICTRCGRSLGWVTYSDTSNLIVNSIPFTAYKNKNSNFYFITVPKIFNQSLIEVAYTTETRRYFPIYYTDLNMTSIRCGLCNETTAYRVTSPQRHDKELGSWGTIYTYRSPLRPTKIIFQEVNFVEGSWAELLMEDALMYADQVIFQNCTGTITTSRLETYSAKLRFEGSSYPKIIAETSKYANWGGNAGTNNYSSDWMLENSLLNISLNTGYNSNTPRVFLDGQAVEYTTSAQTAAPVIENNVKNYSLRLRTFPGFNGSQIPQIGSLEILTKQSGDINITNTKSLSISASTSGNITVDTRGLLQSPTLQSDKTLSVTNLTVAGTSTTLEGGNINISALTAPTGNTAITTSKAGDSFIKNSTFNGLTLKMAGGTAELASNIINGLSKIDAPGASITLKSCVYKDNLTVTDGSMVVIDGGNYTGSPAVTGNNVTVKRGTFTDNSGTSTFIVDPDSEATVTTSGNKTITTVKLSNPPVIIDWDNFPGLDIDLSAPTIEVLRNPTDVRTPTDKVTLTIRATDPNGNDDPKPISINGGAFQASPATYTVTENQVVSIVARDANGNVREYQATISNIDSYAPEVTGFTQSTEAWTKDPVRVYCNATDDVKMHLTPYKFEFHPNSGAATITTDWQADRSYLATENGTLYCYVRDSLGKETKSDAYYIRNIDTVAPTATYTLSPPSGEKASPGEGVTIDLTLINTGDPITQDSSAMATTAVKWGSNEAWSESTSKTVYENGVYNIWVRDSVGNVSAAIPITVSNISTDKPVINSFTGTHLTADYVQAPVTLTVEAVGGGTTGLPDKPYSWDGGKTWTSVNTNKVYENGEYTVLVRDSVGTTSEASMVVSNIDAYKPTASVYLFKGLPADATPDMGPDDYVWKIRVEADDIGSGVDHVETLWDGGTYTSFPIIQDIEEAGVYGVIVYDKAGNQIYAEKVVTNEAIGNATGSNNGAYVEVRVPGTGTAGSYFNASIGDLVYGPTGAYNKVTDEFKTYQSGAEGITVNLVATAKSGTTVSGYATFNSVKYPVTFDGSESVRGGKNLEAQVFIPVSALTSDVRNGRLVVVFQEHKSDKLNREGSATLYTSVQINDPKINYTYNKGTDELTMVATSSVAGVKTVTYDLGSGAQSYGAPFTVGGAGTVTLRAVDNVNNVTELVLDGDTLPVAGEGGGSLPTEGITGGGVNSYYIAGKSSETYIIGGTRSNTNNVPSSSVFDAVLGNGG